MYFKEFTVFKRLGDALPFPLDKYLITMVLHSKFMWKPRFSSSIVYEQKRWNEYGIRWLWFYLSVSDRGVC